MKKKNSELAKTIFLNNLSTTKKLLDLLEFKLGKESSEFKYLKKEVFNYAYEGLKKIFKQLESEKIIKKCPNKCNLRQGFKKCECGGSGYLNLK